MSTERATEPRLLLVGNGWGRDGAPLLLLALARGYRAAGYALTTAAPGDGPLRAEFAALGETVSLPDWHGHQPKRSFLAAAARLVALAARERAVAVIANTSQALAGVIAARALRLPCVWCVREGADPATLPFGRWLERACGRDVDLVFEAEAVRRLWAPWLAGPSHVIPNGVPDPGPPQPGDREAAREALGIPLDAEVVVQVGTVCHRKGQDVLLDALEILSKEYDYPGGGPRTYLVGGGAPGRQQEGVTWVGPVDDPAPWYRAANAVVLASREESHPRVVLEAMAHGRAVVATSVGGVSEQVAFQSEGFLFEPNDASQLAFFLAVLQDRPMLATRLATEARRRYEAVFREERMQEGHVALLDRALRRPRPWERALRVLRGPRATGGTTANDPSSSRVRRAANTLRRLGLRKTLHALGRNSAPIRPETPPVCPAVDEVTLSDGVRFSVVVEDLEDAAVLAALKRQPRERWSLALNVPEATQDYVIQLKRGDVLEPGALEVMAAAIAEDPARDVVYGDEIRAGVVQLKPQFCPELLLATPYLGAPVAIRRSLVAVLQGGLSSIRTEVVHHVPRILARTAAPPALNSLAVVAKLEERGLTAEVRPHPAVLNALEIRFQPPPETTVALIVPTRDRADLLGALRRSLQRTTWPHWRLVIVDNGSRDPAALAEIQAAETDGALVVVRDQPFDHSALCNAGAEAAGDVDVFCFLNDDVEVIAPDWLEDLLALALSPPIGAVGARLVFPDGRLQHGGVVLGIGPDRIAGHAHFGEPAHSAGDMGLTRLLGNASAVTGACLAVRRAAFEQVGGFDRAFPTDYNDVDLCLRLRAAGLRTAWTPRAELLHHGGASRPRAIDPAAIAAFRERWADALVDDPCYHPLRTRSRQDFGWD